jgi:hypothetical protein
MIVSRGSMVSGKRSKRNMSMVHGEFLTKEILL